MTRAEWRDAFRVAAALTTGYWYGRAVQRSLGSTATDGAARARRPVGSSTGASGTAGRSGDTVFAAAVAAAESSLPDSPEHRLIYAHSAGREAMLRADLVAASMAAHGSALVASGAEDAGLLWLTASGATLDAIDGPS